MATMKDIACMSGFSLGTVDRALNHKLGVSEETRTLILNLAESLHYQPNPIGQKLVRQARSAHLGVILEPVSNPFFQNILTGVEEERDALAKEGVTTDIFCMNTYREEEMLMLLDTLRAQRVSGVMLNGINSLPVQEKLLQMHREGIKIVTCSSDVENCERDFFVGFPHEKSGRVGAELLSKLAGAEGNFLVMIGYHSIMAHSLRLKGFREKLSESCLGSQITQVLEVEENDSVAMQLTYEALTRYPQINGIFITCYGIRGIMDAVCLKNPDRHIPVIAYDRSQAVRDCLRLGQIDATICQNPELHGQKALQILYELSVNTFADNTTQYLTPIDIRLAENLDE